MEIHRESLHDIVAEVHEESEEELEDALVQTKERRSADEGEYLQHEQHRPTAEDDADHHAR